MGVDGLIAAFAAGALLGLMQRVVATVLGRG